MRKVIFLSVFVIFILPFISSDMIITNSLKENYNIGDNLNLEIKIHPLENTEGFFTITLLCPGKETEVHKEYVSIPWGDEKKISLNLPLVKNFIGPYPGNCKIKPQINEKFILSEEFFVSDKIEISLISKQKEFEPEKSIILEGEAKKENNNPVEGFIDIKIRHNEKGELIEITNTVKKGYFYINHSISKKIISGEYDVQIEVYEKDSLGEKTNKGLISTSIIIKQVPTNLELILENEKVTPGKEIRVKPILYDQAGEKIPSEAIITLKDSSGRIKTQESVNIGEFFEFPIEYNEPAREWEVIAISEKITTKTTLEIIEHQDVSIEIINRTVIIQNKGNIPYNKTILIEIGNETRKIETLLKVNEEKKYTLTAPEGEYEVKIDAEGKEIITKTAILTGKAIDVRENPEGVNKFARNPLSWILTALLFILILFIIILKRKKKIFFNYSDKQPNKKDKLVLKEERPKKTEIKRKNSIIPNTDNIESISLSMKGERHKTEIICLKIKNIQEIKKNIQGIEETMENIKNNAKKTKSNIYEGENSLFFIFSPKITKTFQNQKNAIELGNKILELLKNHNKKYKQKIDYGISIHNGEIISKYNSDSKTINFMPIGNLMNLMKKVAEHSKEEILITKEFKESAATILKTKKYNSKEIDAYTIEEIKNREAHKKFLDSFVKRQTKDSETN